MRQENLGLLDGFAQRLKQLRDALNEMVLAYQQQGKEIPVGDSLIEQVPIEIKDVRQTA